MAANIRDLLADIPTDVKMSDLTVGEGRAYVVEGIQVAVFRMPDGTVRALGAVCPHRGGPIADGQTDSTKVMCPLHQYTFSFQDGGCTNSDDLVWIDTLMRLFAEQVLDDLLNARDAS